MCLSQGPHQVCLCLSSAKSPNKAGGSVHFGRHQQYRPHQASLFQVMSVSCVCSAQNHLIVSEALPVICLHGHSKQHRYPPHMRLSQGLHQVCLSQGPHQVCLSQGPHQVCLCLPSAKSPTCARGSVRFSSAPASPSPPSVIFRSHVCFLSLSSAKLPNCTGGYARFSSEPTSLAPPSIIVPSNVRLLCLSSAK
jgi:hypothetical protein